MRSALERRLSERRDDEGFTLIELMVVILIIAILLAIAIPTFLGARSRAQDRAAQSSLRNALTAADTSYANLNSYLKAIDGTNGDIASVEPALTFCGVGGSAACSGSGNVSLGPNEIAVAVQAGGGTGPSDFSTAPVSTDSPQVWAAAAMSKSGQCFAVMTVKEAGTSAPVNKAGTFYNQWTPASSSTGCKPADATSGNWVSSWT
ncbi:MAG TPA: prepilin-type N-terminal cleavage/methylation domain-containing protein [Acidimicrobiales bacterium]|nr:prepilin-type N-terminal cleavage/methylation domain-containing protein [Acidimicrobiales bacterium]